jgi:hypothetical protein
VGPLFKALAPNAKAVCKLFDALCNEVHIEDLQIKDFRRGFINRNKYSASSMDLVKIMGTSSLLNEKARPILVSRSRSATQRCRQRRRTRFLTWNTFPDNSPKPAAPRERISPQGRFRRRPPRDEPQYSGSCTQANKTLSLTLSRHRMVGRASVMEKCSSANGCHHWQATPKDTARASASPLTTSPRALRA